MNHPQKKRCKGCGISKPVREFRTEKKNSDGKTGKCALCLNKQSVAWCNKNREKRRGIARAYGVRAYHQDPEKYLNRKRERMRDPSYKTKHDARSAERQRLARLDAVRGEKLRELGRKRQADPLHQKRLKARDKTRYAIRKGKLIRQPCEVCGYTPAEAHHDDYDKPLEVRWLCTKHHNEHHHG